MLSNHDIRIGNWVMPDFSETYIKIIDKEGDNYLIDPQITEVVNQYGKIVNKTIDRLPAFNLEGILITAEILKHFGFAQVESPDTICWYFSKNVIPLNFSTLFYVTEISSNYGIGYVYKKMGSKYEIVCDEIRSFHQIQNCFYKESGIELF
ncbi:MAG TPA: hypothetical protein VKI61_09045 [Chitinophagaceae bacterium]|jgi:hypothetical protein|nr:hypothetical protein [Chitinophagaceae bacterium]